MGIKNALHAKKLKLHMQIISDDVDNMDKELQEGCISFNSIWVARWLDDIGLTQYKGDFFRKYEYIYLLRKKVTILFMLIERKNNVGI